jgi:hypothetical protein
MPSADPQRQWFPEMIQILRQEWKSEPPWDDLTLLAARLDTTLQQIRKDRDIIPPMCICSKCGARGRSSPGRITVNAAILAAGRFGITEPSEVKELSKRWKKYHAQHGLDHYGGKDSEATSCQAVK